MITSASRRASFYLCAMLALAACGGATKEKDAQGAAAKPYVPAPAQYVVAQPAVPAPAVATPPAPAESEPEDPPAPGVYEGGRRVWPEPAFAGAKAPGLEGASFMIVYRHTYHAFLGNRGYDTEVFRFRTGAGGAIEQCRITRLMPEGEVAAGSIECARSGGRIAVKPGKGIEDTIGMELAAEGSALVARGEDLVFSYSPAGSSGFRLERRLGERVYSETWTRSGDKVTSLVEDTFDGGAKGHFEGAWPRPRFYIERPDKEPAGGADLEYTFYDTKAGPEFRAEGVESICEVLAVGLDAAFPSGLSLEALALIDICLGGDSRRLTPFFARGRLGGS